LRATNHRWRQWVKVAGQYRHETKILFPLSIAHFPVVPARRAKRARLFLTVFGSYCTGPLAVQDGVGQLTEA
jgi:hypothetical protein